MRRSDGSTPTPQIPHSSALPSFIRRSWYIAWWARWNPPTPTCTTPTASARRSYVGPGTLWEAMAAMASEERVPAVHHERRPGHEARGVRREEDQRGPVLLRHGVALHRRVLDP